MAARAIDLLLLGVLGASIAGVVALAEEWGAPLREAVTIDLSPSALPGYTLLSLSRGLAAYVLSLAFTLVVGTLAAHSRRAERVLIPMLDIGQGIPVLGFLPGLVLGMVALFPRTNVGLELACVVMIFTGQVWNMAFSFYGSLRPIPTELYEVARLHRFSWWKTFRTVELPSSVIGLVWNSMMSMAGGWFFLTVNEAFVLGGRDFRLPGVGSYMAVAIERGDTRAMVWAVVAMTVMIVAVDQLLWRPLVVWSQKFRVEETGSEEPPASWVVSLLRRSRLLRRLRRSLRRATGRGTGAGRGSRRPPGSRPAPRAAGLARRRAALGGVLAAAGAALWGSVPPRRPPRAASRRASGASSASRSARRPAPDGRRARPLGPLDRSRRESSSGARAPGRAGSSRSSRSSRRSRRRCSTRSSPRRSSSPACRSRWSRPS